MVSPVPLLPPLALLAERLLGYPAPLFALAAHPVVWMGTLLGALERRLNRRHWSGSARRLGGAVALAVVLAATVGCALALQGLTRLLPQGWVLEALLATPLLAQRHLGAAVRRVEEQLADSLAAGRLAVGEIVGRDTTVLDEAGVARAAIETLAENTSDAVVAPLLWLALFGLPGIAAYKAINTADSMVGHRSDRYRHFGWASARLDDLVNLLPSRLTAVLFAAAATVIGADAGGALRAAWRDAGRHASPNAGWPEAAMAGALGVQLGGPRSYGGHTMALPAMGAGRAMLTPADIGAARRLYRASLTLLLAVSTAAGLLAAMLLRT